jgi:hypothetical protein
MTITQVISTLPDNPDPAIDAPTVFSQKAAASVLAQKAMVPELNAWSTQANALALALNLNSTNDTSASSNTLGTGAKTFTVSTGKSFQPGMYLVFADTAAPSTNSMLAQVTSYSGPTLVVNSISYSGSGTKTAWVISQSAPIPATVGNNSIVVNTGNGSGSTNTVIRRFSTTQLSVGTAITYADSAAAGASFTITEDGIYAMTYQDLSVGGSSTLGISINSSQLTTSIVSITAANRLAMTRDPGASLPGVLTCVERLVPGDVIRPHGDGAASLNSTANYVKFSIRKIGI